MLYKLKTDLPTFKAGDLFYFDQNGDLIHKDSEIMAYSGITLEKFPNALEKFWKPVEEEYKRWRAKKGDKFYYVDLDGHATYEKEGDYNYDGNYITGNYFKTEAEAQAAADYLKALTTVRDDANGFAPDWSDGAKKWFVSVNRPYAGRGDYGENDITTLDVDWTVGNQSNGVLGLPYFKTVEDVKASIEKHRKEWETIFGVKARGAVR